MRLLLAMFTVAASAATVPLDVSGLRNGPVTVQSTPESATVRWSHDGRAFEAEFSLDPARPLITAIRAGGKLIIDRAQPIYRCSTGKRRGGWDQFFDFPPSHPEGTRSFEGKFQLRAARARTAGNRVEMYFDGLDMGIFHGGIAYTFYPESRLILQEAVMKTEEPDTAYFYSSGLRITADADRRPGRTMASEIAFYDTAGKFQRVNKEGSERWPEAVRYRTLAARTPHGAIAVFPPPHRYFMPRDYTTNMGYLWHTEWRGAVSIGIRQLPDDNSPFYPWMNAPPGTEQHMGVFYLIDDKDPKSVIDDVVRYTHADRFPTLDGYKTFAPHWHLSYTEQAMANGFEWTPPFKPVMKAMGIDAAMIDDFHGDLHPQDLTDLRLQELDAYYKACKAQSDPEFLLIPSEEANVYLGGHWILVFPKPVLWHMKSIPGRPFRDSHPKYGAVYHVGDAKQMLDLIRLENGIAYQSHPRTKGSTGYPDKIRDTEHFRDPRYIGFGWKAMNSDLSSPRLGERTLKLLDDSANWGPHKIMLGEVDVFQIDSTHELYGHMNVNYVRIPNLPSWENYGQLLDAVQRGDFFLSTGEVLLPAASLTPAEGDSITVKATIRHTFPLEFAEVVWGDGSATRRKIIPLDTTHEFGAGQYTWKIAAPRWKWARLAVWDIAANGAMINPVWR
ncbi:MAG: hypothetical protein IT165_18165 [Bryobacterales bacterium]|nr:hypothetical protein [Bryobacterales bacterium]